MILIHNSNPAPRTIWLIIYSVARKTHRLPQTGRTNKLKFVCLLFENNWNIDSDYLMETMGKYALSIT